MSKLFFALIVAFAGIAAAAPADSTENDLNELHDVFVGLTDKVASFAEKFITNVQTGIDELLKSGKLEELNQTVGDDLKAGVQEAKDGLQELGKAINAGLQKLAESAEKASAAKSAPGPSAKAVPAVIAA